MEEAVNCLTPGTGRKDRGFTLLELTVVVSLIAVLAVVALDKYLELLVDVERASMEQNLGALRSAVALQMADRLVKGDMAGAAAMVGTNPMRYLSEIPFNYVGEMDGPDPAAIQTGYWYFDTRQDALIYRVRHDDYFKTALAGPTRARFGVVPIYGERRKGADLAGLSIRPLEPYRWLRVPVWRE